MIRTLAATGLAASLAFPALAQTPDFGGLNGRRDVVRQVLQERSFNPAAGPFYMMLDEGGRQSVRLPVTRGVAYAFVGVCDADCTVINLVLRNGNGDVIGSDLSVRKASVVELQPDMDAVVTIEAVMTTCSQPPCYAVVDVFWNR